MGFLKEPYICEGTVTEWITIRLLTTVSQIFNASHMVPYDLPHVAHDMILRFMGVNFSAIVDGSARIPSSIGSDTKPLFLGSDKRPTSNESPPKSPQQDKAMWEGTLRFSLCLAHGH
jgi:carboxypeptidase D